MTHLSRTTVATIAAAAALMLTACSSGGADSNARGTSSPSTSAAAVSSASDAASPAASPSPKATTPAKDAGATQKPAAPQPGPDRSGFSTRGQQSKNYPAYGMDQVVASRVATHDGYDRIVVEYSGKDPISFTGGYVDTPLAEGSGLPIKVAGKAYIQLTVAGATYPDPAVSAKASDILPPNLGGAKVVKGVDVKYPFEGMHEVTIGLDQKRPYRVQIFTNPQRLVIDVLH